MKYRFMGSTIIFFLLLIGLLMGFEYLPSIDSEGKKPDVSLPQVQAEEIEASKNFEPEIEDQFMVKQSEIDTQVYHVYVTAYPSDNQKTVNFEEVKVTNDISSQYLVDREDPYASIYYSTSPEDSNARINGTIEQRGQSARIMKQKSFKIKIEDRDSLWFGYDTINLNKHFEDQLRIRNKLSYDLFRGMDNIVGLDTRFVELHVKDLAQGETEFKSYGLFTFVEQPDKDYLDKMFNDKYGLLYKAEFFEFFNYKAIESTDSATYDEEAFENHLEVKGADDHKYLKNMLEDLNDYNKDINEIIETYFHEENMLTWMAFNMLTSNYDSNSRNYMLYSSVNKSKWYFIPWDYDKAWQYKYYNGKWERGASVYWGLVLFNRYMRKTDNFQKVINKVEELHDYLNQERILAYLSAYQPVVNKYLFQEPDDLYLKASKESYNDEIMRLAKLPHENYEYFMAHLEDPMPFYYGEEVITDSAIEFQWDESFDLQGDRVTYEFILASDYTLNDVIYNEKDMLTTRVVIESLPQGTYYWKVIGTDSKGNWQTSFERFTDNNLIREFGVRQLVIE